jgi:hypothetical protein
VGGKFARTLMETKQTKKKRYEGRGISILETRKHNDNDKRLQRVSFPARLNRTDTCEYELFYPTPFHSNLASPCHEKPSHCKGSARLLACCQIHRKARTMKKTQRAESREQTYNPPKHAREIFSHPIQSRSTPIQIDPYIKNPNK